MDFRKPKSVNPSPVIYRHQHAFNAAQALIRAGGFTTDDAWFEHLGFYGEVNKVTLTYQHFAGRPDRSGFTEDGGYWVEGRMLCEVLVQDQWGRKLQGTFTDPKWGLAFQDDGTWPTLFRFKPEWLR